MYTTNEEDQRKAAEIKASLEEDSSDISQDATGEKISAVAMDEGAHKYVLMSANDETDKEQHFVVSSQWAHYHRDAAEPMIDNLRRAGYHTIRVLGGGRIDLNSLMKKVSIFGFSYGFGQADHSISKRVVESDPRYKGFTVETSDEGYWLIDVEVVEVEGGCPIWNAFNLPLEMLRFNSNNDGIDEMWKSRQRKAEAVAAHEKLD